jgi:hypothetical protein
MAKRSPARTYPYQDGFKPPGYFTTYMGRLRIFKNILQYVLNVIGNLMKDG